MTIQTQTQPPKKPRKVRKDGVSRTLRLISEQAAQALEELRREDHRARKDEERVRILLTLHAGPILEMLKRIDIPEDDRSFLVAKGYIREKKG